MSLSQRMHFTSQINKNNCCNISWNFPRHQKRHIFYHLHSYGHVGALMHTLNLQLLAGFNRLQAFFGCSASPPRFSFVPLLLMSPWNTMFSMFHLPLKINGNPKGWVKTQDIKTWFYYWLLFFIGLLLIQSKCFSLSLARSLARTHAHTHTILIQYNPRFCYIQLNSVSQLCFLSTTPLKIYGLPTLSYISGLLFYTTWGPCVLGSQRLSLPDFIFTGTPFSAVTALISYFDRVVQEKS